MILKSRSNKKVTVLNLEHQLLRACQLTLRTAQMASEIFGFCSLILVSQPMPSLTRKLSSQTSAMGHGRPIGRCRNGPSFTLYVVAVCLNRIGTEKTREKTINSWLFYSRFFSVPSLTRLLSTPTRRMGREPCTTATLPKTSPAIRITWIA